jgi:hypothetical protein
MILSPAVRRYLKNAIKAATPIFWTRNAIERRRHFIEGLKGVPSFLRMRLVNREKRFALNLVNRDKRVVFVADSPLRREPKFAYALKRAGWEVVLLHRDPLAIGNQDDFCDIQRYGSPGEAVELAWKAKARLFHNFSAGHDDSMIHLLQNKPGRVIVDLYDIFHGIIDGLGGSGARYSAQELQQQFCIENADAICCRDLQFWYLRHTTGIGHGVPALSFPAYCWDRHVLTEKTDMGPGPHIVQVGGMELETQGEYDTSFFRVVIALVEAGCHFHIFLSRGYTQMMQSRDPLHIANFQRLFADYLNLQSGTGRIHFHPFCTPDQLIGQLAQFDFGFALSNAASFEDVPWNTHDPAWLPYFGASRFFDYLDAGIAFLADGNQAYNRHLFRGTGAYLDGTEIIRSGCVREALAYPPSRATVLEGRRRLAAEHNIRRLIRFYENLD